MPSPDGGGNDRDLIIVGGGMTGATLAAALAGSALRVTLLEAVPFDSGVQPSFDRRTVALTYSSRCIFEMMGLWRHIAAEGAWPILRILVSRRNQPGVTRLSCRDAGTGALGYVVPHRVIGGVLQRRIAAAANVDVLCPATAQTLEVGPRRATVTLSDGKGGGAPRRIAAPLVVLADGGRSEILANTGLHRSVHEYPEAALVTMVRSDRPHDGCAWEKFTTEGPLALLPVERDHYALAWSLERSRAAEAVALGEDAFLALLQQSFGRRAGLFSEPGTRHVYPLRLAICTPQARQRLALAGNTAHTVHPVAGQGFNMGLRDVADLCCILHTANGAARDIGSAAVMQAYVEARRRDRASVIGFTGGLLSLFSSEWPPFAAARGAGLSLLNLAPPLKRALLRRSMGLSGGQLWMRELPSCLGSGE